VAEGELPTEVKEQLFSRRNGGNSRRRAFRHIASEQRGGTRPGRAGGQGGDGESQS
jgi:hypothetical protein